MKTLASSLLGIALLLSSGGDIASALGQNPPRLANISTRGQVLTADNVMIGGFVIGGSAPKSVVVRARGPSLAQFGVAGVLANPMLRLYSGQAEIAQNDDFTTAPNLMLLNASGFAPTDSRESAILTTLSPGAYTAIVSGVNDSTGVAIIEVFEVDAPTVPLVNISTRGQVLVGDEVMIAGFIVQGSAPQRVFLRARGPSLQSFGLTGLLANPRMTLFSGQTPIASNDNWEASSIPGDVGGDQMHPNESAILITLNPGGYTAIVEGVANGTGLAIVEVFAVATSGDTVAPHLISTSPPHNALQAEVVDPITVTFSEPVAPASVTSGSFTLVGPDGPVAATRSVNGNVATLTPSARLATATAYSASVSTGIRDLAGNALAFPASFNFTTSETEPTPIVAGCPAPESTAQTRSVPFGSSQTVRRPTGTVMAVRIPQSPSGRASVQLLETTSAATPGGASVEITFSRCPGVIETNLHPSCMMSTSIPMAVSLTVFNRPLTQERGWTTQDQHAGLGCLLPTQEPSFANIRWTFPSCEINAGCGFALSWAEGGY